MTKEVFILVLKKNVYVRQDFSELEEYAEFVILGQNTMEQIVCVI